MTHAKPLKTQAVQRAKRLAKRLLADTSGGAAIWAALAFPMVGVGAALSMDVARLQSLDGDLQSAADALARAGAGELDQASDSLMRADAAVYGLLNNTKRGEALRSTKVEVNTIRYLTHLPEPSWKPVTAAHLTTDPKQARFIEVAVKPGRVTTVFPTSTAGKFTRVSLDARAVAGLDIGVCGSAPVFICNPFEGQATTIQQAAKTLDFQRRQITLIGKGGGSKYSPGNFGWLDPFDNNSGADVLRDQIARTVSDVCVSKSKGVSLRPGRISSMSQGINTKFDIYEGKMSKMADDPLYAPAQNVVKGQANQGVCGADISGSSGSGGNGKGKGKGKGKKTSDPVSTPLALGFGRDSASGSELGDRIGNGDWDFFTYMDINHPKMSRITLDGITYKLNFGRGMFTPSKPPSRYSLYRWEIENNCVPGRKTYKHMTVTEEEGLPVCNTNTPPPGVDPRVLSVAVVNCQAVQDSGIAMNGRKSGIPVETFVRVFLTEPMGSGQDDVLYGEIIGEVMPSNDTASRDRVAVVR